VCENISNAAFDAILRESVPSQQGCHKFRSYWRKHLAMHLGIQWKLEKITYARTS